MALHRVTRTAGPSTLKDFSSSERLTKNHQSPGLQPHPWMELSGKQRGESSIDPVNITSRNLGLGVYEPASWCKAHASAPISNGAANVARVPRIARVPGVSFSWSRSSRPKGAIIVASGDEGICECHLFLIPLLCQSPSAGRCQASDRRQQWRVGPGLGLGLECRDPTS